jgi:hypothetical protein
VVTGDRGLIIRVDSLPLGVSCGGLLVTISSGDMPVVSFGLSGFSGFSGLVFPSLIAVLGSLLGSIFLVVPGGVRGWEGPSADMCSYRYWLFVGRFVFPQRWRRRPTPLPWMGGYMLVCLQARKVNASRQVWFFSSLGSTLIWFFGVFGLIVGTSIGIVSFFFFYSAPGGVPGV